MIPARSVFMTSRTIVQCPGAASGAGVQCGDIMNCVSPREGKITRTAVLLLGKMWARFHLYGKTPWKHFLPSSKCVSSLLQRMWV